jgi:Holliday junction resolvase RusA-like endonuclease
MAISGHLTTELPPSGNNYKRVRTTRGFVDWYLTDAAKRYKTLVATITAAIDNPLLPTRDPVRLDLVVYSNDKARDLDNFLKVLLDALQYDPRRIGYGGIYYDDKQVVGFDRLELEYDYQEPRIELGWRAGPEFAKEVQRRSRGRKTPSRRPSRSASPRTEGAASSGDAIEPTYTQFLPRRRLFVTDKPTGAPTGGGSRTRGDGARETG